MNCDPGNQKGLNDREKRQKWAISEAVVNSDRLDINNYPVMQRWETPFMMELAKVACENRGRVLEVGFGMGISARAIQQLQVQEHIILEANKSVFDKLQTFISSCNHPIVAHGPAFWQDSIDLIQDESLDGILYDAYPVVWDEQHTHQFDFIAKAYKKMLPGGILTYCNLTSFGVLRGRYDTWETLFNETQLPQLIKCGIPSTCINFKIVSVSPPPDCEYYNYDTAIVPICRKPFSALSDTSKGDEQVTKVPLLPPASASAGILRATNKISALKMTASEISKAEQELQTLKKQVMRKTSLWSVDGKPVTRRVNAWTQWGNLKEVVVGVADNGCFIPTQPACHPSVNREGGSNTTHKSSADAGSVISDELPWPKGRKKQAKIDAANAQLDNLAKVLEQRGIRVLRPDPSINWDREIKTPFFTAENQFCCVCGRDSVITIGNIILEATMSRRDRYFEVMAFRDIISELHKSDKNMLWKAAPKPTMRDGMYREEWWDLDLETRYKRMHDFTFCVSEDEPVFDAADITRCGKDIFVQLSMTCNRAGIEWLRRELSPHGIRVHMVRFPYDLAPSHLDCTFVPLRPGLVLTNPDRPCMEEDLKLLRKNGWRFIEAPPPVNSVRPWASQSSKWLSMNVLVIGPHTVVVEAEETSMKQLLENEGFEVISVPFRDVYEFGGGLHCATWDIERDDRMDDFFPNQH